MKLNLIRDRWLPIRRRNGKRELISPSQIVSQLDNPVIEFDLARPDFESSAYQYLIGLLQTAFSPLSIKHWKSFWQSPPNEEVLQDYLSPFADAFDVFGDYPLFMQDPALKELKEAKETPIFQLFIEAPGEKTIEENTDHFVKRGRIKSICPSCAVLALLTMQINAPEGGQGYRVGIRGGGPLTTLLVPEESPGIHSTLWEKIWLNILTSKVIEDTAEVGAEIFPWLRKDLTGDCFPSEVFGFEVYWAMPRRVLLQLQPGDGLPSECDTCGADCRQGRVTSFYRLNSGIRYQHWLHPLSPYRKKQKELFPFKGGALAHGYRDWENLALVPDNPSDDSSVKKRSYSTFRAKILTDYQENKIQELEEERPIKIWGCGYEMDKMKPIAWHSSLMPVITLKQEMRALFYEAVDELTQNAVKALQCLERGVKESWNTKEAPSDLKQLFWLATEGAFYSQVYLLKQAFENKREKAPIFENWKKKLRCESLYLFDQKVLDVPIEDIAMKRAMGARRFLEFLFFESSKKKGEEKKQTMKEGAA